MVAGLGLVAFVAIGGDGDEAFGKARGQKRVVDAKAEVAAPGAGLVIPESVGLAAGLNGAESIGEPAPKHGAEGGAGFGAEECVAGRERAGSEILIGRADIVVAGEGAGLVGLKKHLGAVGEALHPAELVGVAVGTSGITVRKVEICHRDAVGADLEIAGLRIGFHAGKAAMDDLDGLLREDGDAVVGFLAEDLGAVADVFEGLDRELRIFAFDLLQEQKVGLVAAEPSGDMALALADRVDVPGGEFQDRAPRTCSMRSPIALGA